MKWQFEDRNTNGRFSVIKQDTFLKGAGILNQYKETTNTIVCNLQQDQTVVIDQVPYLLATNTILPLVANQHFVFEHPETLVAWQFNRDFYCIADHDAEVGCVGFLFYGIRHPMFIPLSSEEREQIELILKLSMEEMQIKDKMQGEMLRLLLKRLIIYITRIAKKQTENYCLFGEDKMDLVRMFNLLLEINFRSQHEVHFYANALNKSPKTLANLFATFKYPSPSRLIQQRIILEAKRQLNFTSLSAKEIAYALGFISPQHFSRFFKQHTGSNTSAFRGSKA
ncbi:AraC family transcriptional regulator [Chitinophaga defluvii]|uniref:Helix-turn-helix domain-containing protein n=1 Tax=Chitinophaga defluvii TaxID=3163343 RepID=A0ABV2TAG3_9BACT